MPVALPVSSKACRGGSGTDMFAWLVAAGVDVTGMPADGRLFCADDCRAGLPGDEQLENPNGTRCWRCRHTRTAIIRTLSTLVLSIESGAYSMGVATPLPQIPASLPEDWSRKMIWSSGAVLAPLLFPDMRFIEHRNTLADLFCSWMASAQQAPLSSQPRTMLDQCDGLYFGITSDVCRRHNAHTQAWGKTTSEWNMLGMVSLAAGMQEDKNMPWQDSAEGTLRLRAEEVYPHLPIINQPENDMQGLKAVSRGILSVKSWSDGGAKEYEYIRECTRRGIKAADRGTGVIRLMRQMAWGNSATIVYALLLQRKRTE